MDKLQEEFTDYQLLHYSEIPDADWKAALTYEEEIDTASEKKQYHRMDVTWAFLLEMKNITSSLRFGTLSTVARLVLVILHSNTVEKRVFH